jgi:hypothetical protein
LPDGIFGVDDAIMVGIECYWWKFWRRLRALTEQLPRPVALAGAFEVPTGGTALNPGEVGGTCEGSGDVGVRCWVHGGWTRGNGCASEGAGCAAAVGASGLCRVSCSWRPPRHICKLG